VIVEIDTSGNIIWTSQNIGAGAHPHRIVVGPVQGGSQNLWFSQTATAVSNNLNRIGEIQLSDLTYHSSDQTFYDNPTGVTVGPDNNIWEAEAAAPMGASSAGIGDVDVNLLSVTERAIVAGTACPQGITYGRRLRGRTS
jgi:hypothetical protein